jgi:hypothetical protein
MVLFGKPMRRVPTVFKRMTVWAQHFKIAEIVVFTVSIFVVNTENLRMFRIATSNTFGQHPSRQHILAHRDEFWLPFRLVRFVDTRFRAIFAFGGRRVQKCDSAMHTVVLNRSFFVHGFVIAARTAVFGFACTARNVRKKTAALGAICRNLRSCGQRHARLAAILSSVFSVFRHCEICATMLARNRVTHFGA